MKIKLTHKAVTAVTVALVLIVISAVAVFAYLRWSSNNSVTNTFTPDDEVDPTINETFDTDANQKTDVSVDVGNNAVANDTGYSVYVRAAIVVTWASVDDPYVVLATPPEEGEDYSIDLTTDDADAKWFKCGDFYYYEDAVASGGKTEVLINSCKPLREAPVDGYVLNVRIISQTIQALGTTDGNDSVSAAEDAWKVVEVDANGKLVPVPAS